MYPLDPVLPDDWRANVDRYEPEGLDYHWKRNAKQLLKRHGLASFAIPDVQLLVVLANGLGISYLRPPEWILSFPEHEWALEQVWMERGTDGNLWSAVQNMRALETELVVLKCLAFNEYRPIKEDRRHGHDWHLAKDNRDFYLEVKSQGEVTAHRDFVNCSFVGQQLVDRTGFLRRYHLNYYSPTRGRQSQMDWAARKIADIGALLAAELAKEQRLLVPVEFSPTPTGGSARIALRHGGRWSLDLRRDAEWGFHVEGVLSRLAGWMPIVHCAHSDHVPSRVSEASRLFIADKLAKLIIGDGSQLRDAPANTLVVVMWPAPLSWDDALADHREDVLDILGAITRNVHAQKPEVAIGLWIEAYERTTGTIILNQTGESLLGLPSIHYRARR